MILREVLRRKAPLYDRDVYRMPKPIRENKSKVERKATRESLPRAAKPVRVNTPQPVEQGYYIAWGYGLSPAILETCQILFDEGWSVLYGENILTIDILTQPVRKAQVPHVYMSATFSSLIHREGGRLCLDSNARRYASHFKLFELVLHNQHSTKHLREVLRLMQPVLSRPTVHLHITFVSTPATRIHAYDVKAFQLLRCKSLTINGVSRELSDEVFKVVTDKSKILDLSKAKKKLEPMRKYLIQDSSPVARALAASHFAQLTNAIYDFDVNKFEEVRSEILDLFDAEMAHVKERLFEKDTWKH